MAAERTVRAFLALDPPAEVRAGIGRIQERLRRRVRGEIRWVRPEAVHLTLKYFGEIPESDVAVISEVAAAAAAGVGPFDLFVGGLGVFPDRARSPRVIWLGIGGEVAALADFQRRLEEALAGIGFPREERPFRPHLTLARVRSPKGLSGLDALQGKGEEVTAGRFCATALALFNSDLAPGGAIYTRLAGYPFAGPRGA